MKSNLQTMLQSVHAGAATEIASTEAIFTKVSEQIIQGGGSGAVSSATASMSMENFGTAQSADVLTAVKNLHQVVTGAYNALITPEDKAAGNGKLTFAQESAAIMGGMFGFAPKEFLKQPIHHSLEKFRNDNTVVVGNASPDALEKRSFSAEAYDNQVNTQSAVFAMTYNLRGARQNEFGEAFYPTIVITPENVGFMISIRLLYVQDDVRRQVTGALDNFNRRSVLRAEIDHTILANDATRIYPVFRETGQAATDNTAHFVEAAGVRTVTQDGKPVTTAPLKIGAQYSLLGLSQTDAQLARGFLDQTDAIGSSVSLESIYLEVTATVGGNPVTEYFQIPTKDLPMSDFNAAVQGNTRMLTLNFINHVTLKPGQLTTSGSAATTLAALGTNSLRLNVNLFGNVAQQDTATSSINAAPVNVAAVYATNGDSLVLTSGQGQTAAALAATIKVAAYDLYAHRTNSNKRTRGQFIDTQTMNYLYTVPLLPPITALRPLTDGDTNDAALAGVLVQTIYKRTSSEAVRTLIDSFASLKAHVNNGAKFDEASNVVGVARHLLKPIVLDRPLDLAAQLDSLTSTDRRADVANLFLNKIRDMAIVMITDSGYKVAADAVYDGAAPKPLVIVGTSPTIASYLTLNGDTRTLGDTMDIKIVETYDERIRDQIYIGLGASVNYNSGVPAPLHNGNMAWKPELPIFAPISRNDQISQELTVHPCFRHVQNLPVMGRITVTNLHTVVSSKVAIHNKPVV